MAHNSTAVDLALLARAAEPIVRRAFGRAPGATTAVSLAHAQINPSTAGLFRLSGDGWSLVLKVVHSPAGGATPRGVAPAGWGESVDHWNYWRREPLLYRSGALSSLPGRLRAPMCHGVDDQDDGTIRIWLEDVCSDPAWTTWSPERFRLTARHLGQMNGGVIGRSAPSIDAAVAHGWLRSWMEDVWGSLMPLVEDPAAWRRPLIARHIPESFSRRMIGLWRDRERLLTALERLPTTTLHRDAHPNNLFTRRAADGEWETVAIDWTQASLGPLGAEVGQTAVMSHLLFREGGLDLPALDSALLEGYLTGLRDAGWSGDPSVVRLGHALATGLHWGFAAAFALRWAADPALAERVETLWDRPIEELVARRAAVTRHLLDRTDVALAEIG